MCFKPYYKWITFNTFETRFKQNLEIELSFKPYYKWITFNTLLFIYVLYPDKNLVLNLIING